MPHGHDHYIANHIMHGGFRGIDNMMPMIQHGDLPYIRLDAALHAARVCSYFGEVNVITQQGCLIGPAAISATHQ